MQRKVQKYMADHQRELLAAALLGAAVGAGLALMMRRRPKGGRAVMAGIDDIAGQMRDYLDETKGTVRKTMRGEMQDLQKAMRRRRRQLGI